MICDFRSSVHNIASVIFHLFQLEHKLVVLLIMFQSIICNDRHTSRRREITLITQVYRSRERPVRIRTNIVSRVVNSIGKYTKRKKKKRKEMQYSKKSILHEIIRYQLTKKKSKITNLGLLIRKIIMNGAAHFKLATFGIINRNNSNRTSPQSIPLKSIVLKILINVKNICVACLQ